MLKLKKNYGLKLFLAFLIFQAPVFAVSEFDFQFSYDRKIYGLNRENKQTVRTYSFSLAQYFFSFTAFEISYSDSDKIINDNQNVEVDDLNLTIVSRQHRYNTKVYSIGLRQALTGRNSVIRPLISVGYARQFVTYDTDISYELDSGEDYFIQGDTLKYRNDLAFGTFSLQIRITRGFALKGSVKTMIPAFDTDKVRDYLEYLAGFTWIF